MSAVAEQPRTDFEPQRKTWSLAEFQKLSDEGHFPDQRVELLAGEIYIMPRQDYTHSYALDVLYEYCRELYQKEHWVRYQSPIHVGGDSYLEPDVSVVSGTRDSYQDHPDQAHFVAEVSNYTLRHDRRKAGLYARAGIPEYWIVNLPSKQLEIYRNPHPDETKLFRFGYDEPIICQPGDAATLLLRPDRPFDVKRLFR